MPSVDYVKRIKSPRSKREEQNKNITPKTYALRSRLKITGLFRTFTTLFEHTFVLKSKSKNYIRLGFFVGINVGI
jgi:hypothetical protein